MTCCFICMDSLQTAFTLVISAFWVLSLGFWAAISSVFELFYISFSSTGRCQHRSSRLRFHIRQ
jgi:hypothetical protein